ncbi:WxL domain-containing protein [Lactobacillus sp. HBUAS51381]|uniref:Ig-like domain-containing protein n=1 Tax=Lactobacillus sp. HBUAS51381 TaxID=2722743 RepID=UPI0014565997|nr:WxL domain-containing protein [Lactobacillus sp. HBUAS51381]NLR09122.1 cell surface protein [Lactobacillus sp. HBUAS51381]
MRNWKHILRGLLVSITVLVGWLIIGTTAQAANTSAPQTPTSPPTSILGINLAGGFTQQPIDSNAVAGHNVTLSAKGTRNILEATTNPLGSRKYVWWESTDGGSTYQTVGTNSSTYTFMTPEVTKATPLMFQCEYDFTGIGLFYNEWSRIATVTVTPDRVPTTDIQVSADSNALYNNESTTVHATLTPDNATDPITWTSSNPDLATVDDYGNVTATSTSSSVNGLADDHGIVTITATSNGHDASTKIMIGALQDVTVNEGSDATFTLKNLPDGMTVANWYKVDDGTTTALNSTASSYTVSKTTVSGDNGTSYYAKLNYTVNGSTKSVNTNAALLTVNKSGLLSLTAVPNFNFGSIDTASVIQSDTTLQNLDTATSGSNYDGNNNGDLSVMDSRETGGDWTLTASLAPFTLSDGDNGSLSTVILDLSDPTSRLDQDIPATNTATKIYTSSDYDGQSFDVTDSQLTFAADPKITAGDYQSTVTWTLSVAPS